MKKRYALAFLLTALAGTALHFAYDWCLSPLVGLFAPVNESVWEHLKLLFWPFLAAGFAAALRVNRSGRFGWLAGVLVILTGLYGAALILFTLAPPELPIFMAVS